MTNSILKCCPFCNAQAVYRSEDSGGVVYCDHLWTCPLDGNEKISASETQWNTRAQPVSEPKPVEDIAAELYELAGMAQTIAYSETKAVSHTIMAPRRKYDLDDARLAANVILARLTELADNFTSPAPAGVVLPEREHVHSKTLPFRNPAIGDGYISGWNACLDAVAKLNGAPE